MLIARLPIIRRGRETLVPDFLSEEKLPGTSQKANHYINNIKNISEISARVMFFIGDLPYLMFS